MPPASVEEIAAEIEGIRLFDHTNDGMALKAGVEWEPYARYVAAMGKWLLWDESGGGRTRCCTT